MKASFAKTLTIHASFPAPWPACAEVGQVFTLEGKAYRITATALGTMLSPARPWIKIPCLDVTGDEVREASVAK